MRYDGFHADAVAAGYRSNGEPGERSQYHDGYYAAYVLDPGRQQHRNSSTTTASRRSRPTPSRTEESMDVGALYPQMDSVDPRPPFRRIGTFVEDAETAAAETGMTVTDGGTAWRGTS